MSALIFNIRLEAKTQTSAGKWERTSCETSHWTSAEPILTSYVRANPSHEVRLVAEMIPFPIPDTPQGESPREIS